MSMHFVKLIRNQSNKDVSSIPIIAISWWPEGDRDKNGMRSDFHIISKGLQYTVDYGAIYKSKEFSTHAPIIMDYDIEL